MKNECLKSSVLADFNLEFLPASRVREQLFQGIHVYNVIPYIYVNLFMFLLFSKDDRSSL